MNESSTVLLAGRRAGVCLHISSLPGSFGIGEIGTAARAFVDTMNSMDLSVWQFLPLGPTGYGDSPYQALSSFAGNEILIDAADLIKLGLLSTQDCRQLSKLPASHVAFERLIPAKWRVLQIAADRFKSRASKSVKTAYAEFCAQNENAWLNDYALYRVLKSRHEQQSWNNWPECYAQREPAAMQQFATEAATAITAIKILQFLFHYQWQKLRLYAEKKGVSLLGDLPIYVALDSADAWSHPELLQLDNRGHPENVAGVPPDYFSADGQLWGNPLYDWQQHEATDFSWWRARLAATTKLCHYVRIDHFRGFESYWAVPASEQTARNGKWLPGPGDKILDAFRDTFDTLPVIAEDLGIITPEVEALRDRYGLPGMVVLQFAVADGDFQLEQVTENRVCYTGTHDNDTSFGWYCGSPDDLRDEDEIHRTQKAVRRIVKSDGSDVAKRMIEAAFATEARLAMAPMQDYLGLGSKARLNTPGRAAGNWRWRMQGDAVTKTLSRRVRQWVKQSGRSSSGA